MIAQVIGSLNQLTFMTFVSAVTHHIYNKDAGGAAKQEEAPVLGALSVIRTLPGVRCELYSTKQLTLAQIKTLYFLPSLTARRQTYAWIHLWPNFSTLNDLEIISARIDFFLLTHSVAKKVNIVHF